jgi:5-methylcytosine-specific restriction enzyme A
MPKLTKTRDRGSRDWYQLEVWRKQRRHQLRAEPLCQRCLRENRITPASEVDHIRPHGGDWTEFRSGALQSLCQSCHWEKTMREMGRRTRPRIGLDGFHLPTPDWREDDEDLEDDLDHRDN